jgi:hypothetical protein
VNVVVIPRRYRGPSTSGNGGYVCGVVAGLVARDAEVTLRSPPPLEVPLRVEPDEVGGVRLLDGETLIAEGAPVEPWDHHIPEAPTWEEAGRAAARYAGFDRHAFPECFVCGHHREPGDGLRILAGPVDGRDLVASPWSPAAGLPSSGAVLAREIVWAALDCPGAWSVERAAHDRPVVLGRMAARVFTDVPSGGRYIAAGWPIGAEGRKLYSGTALYDEQGAVLATARQIWIVLA